MAGLMRQALSKGCNLAQMASLSARSVCTSSVTQANNPAYDLHLDGKQHSTYGGRHTVTVIPAHGIGQQLTDSMLQVFQSTGVPIDFEICDINESLGYTFDDVAMSVARNGTCLKGNWITDLSSEGNLAEQSFNVKLRTELDMFANVIQCKSYPSIATRHNNVDLVIVRENTEGEYAHLEHEHTEAGIVESMKITTESSSRRIAKFAFDFAAKNGRKKVTCVHKANIMKLTDGLFLDVCKDVSRDYPDIEFEGMIVDNTAMQLVSKPEQFDVMVTPNLYGNIVANLAAGLIGGPGIPAGSNQGDNYAMFETGTRNSGKGMKGQDVANPMAYIFAACNMLRHLGLQKQANTIEFGVREIVVSGVARTQDIGGTTSTSDFFSHLIENITSFRGRKMQKRMVEESSKVVIPQVHHPRIERKDVITVGPSS